MKKILLSLSAILILLFSSSCTEDVSMDENTVDNEEYVTVNIKLSGEVLEVTQEPMTKGLTTNDLTAIQINEVVVNDHEEEVPYAWGLFDDVSNISVKLKKGTKYNIEATSIINGKNIVYKNGSGYELPFIQSYSKYTFVTNTFDVSYSTKFEYLYESSVDMNYGDYIRHYQYSNVDKYYMKGYIIPEDNSDINIEMNRVSSGLKVIANNLESGCLIIESHEFNKIEINPGEEFDEIYTIPWYNFDQGYKDSWKDDCKTSTTMTFTYQDASGEKTQIASQKIEFTRNKKTVITVNIPDDEDIDSQKNAVKVSLEDTPMVDGDKITIG